jgi:hypothetical protein
MKQTKFRISQATMRRFINFFVISILLVLPALAVPAFASAEAKWDNVISFLLPWITRLGGVVMLLGGIEFGLGFKSDDVESKTKGLRTLIAGAIVIAVGLSSNIFLS